MAEHIVWDYDQKVAVEYERSGECNGCGACCQTKIKFFTNSFFPHEGGRDTDQHGVWVEHAEGDERRFFQFDPLPINAEYHVCPAYSQHAKRCTVHEDKQLICSGFPFAPVNIERFSECSFAFTEVRRWAFEPEVKEVKSPKSDKEST